MSRAWPLLAALLAVACAGEEDAAPGPGAGGAAGSDLGCDGRGQPLAPKLLFSEGDELEVELLELEPAAPALGSNSWLVRLTHAGGAVQGAALQVLPWMPDHEHASTKAVQVSELEPGVYRLSPVYLGMLGFWRVGISVVFEGEELGSVSLDTCLVAE